MRQTVFLVYNESNEFVADEICKNIFINKKIYSKDISADILIRMAELSTTECFYVIKTDKEILFPLFDFSYSIPAWDKNYLHIWNNQSEVRLYHTSSVLESPNKFTDEMLESGNVSIKNIDENIFSYPIFDIVFMSYDESDAEENYRALKSRFPRALHSRGVSGILNAHKACASLVRSSMFYVVDADAEILSTFNFDYQPHSLDRQSVHVWHSINPVNDLVYGYGGVKLFPTKLLLEYNGSPIDFSTSVSKSFKVIPEVSNITKFNTDPFSAWRSGFRECAKLASKKITNQIDREDTDRLVAWTTKGADREFGEFTIMGAIEGRKFGYLHKDQPDMLGLINDYKWLENYFVSQQ